MAGITENLTGLNENSSALTENSTGVLEARSISFSYKRAPVLNDLCFTLQEGDVMVIGGDSGSGKTTLLRLLVGLESPASGELLLRGRSYAEYSFPALRKRVAYLQQLPAMIDASVRDNLLLSFRYNPVGPADENGQSSPKTPGISTPEDCELLERLASARLETIGLDQSARELSVGQRQRLSLLRLLLMRPSVLLLDEPLAALDETSAAAILELLSAEIRQHNTTIMLVSHVLPGVLGANARTMALESGTLKETDA